MLIAAGFEIDGERLKLQMANQIQGVLDKLNFKIAHSSQELEEAKKRIIRENQLRMMGSKDERKKKKLKQQILTKHKEQMDLAKQGIFNVSASVSDRKGTGSGVNSLSHDGK